MATKKKTIPRPKAKKAVAKKSKRTHMKESNEVQEVQVFTIEKGIPIQGKQGNAETNELRTRIDKLVPLMSIGDSFVVPKSIRTTTRKHLSNNWDQYSFRGSSIVSNKEFIRFWRTK